MIQQQTLKQCRQILKKNNLRPIKKLGKGAFSFVFAVEKIQLKSADNQIYSVKCISKKQFAKKPYLIKYIEQQIQNLRDLNHRNIVRLTGTFQDEGWIFILMQFCDKGNLHSVQSTRENRVFQFNECLYIIKSVLDGLQHMHGKNLLHRDIKAENILMLTDTEKKQPYGYVTKICDLGFCREDDDNVTTFCGTTSYMAPEIFGKTIYTNKVDVWAVGVMMYKMLFGDFPFKSLNMEFQINSKCSKGFSLKNIKYRPNSSISKDNFEVLNQIFSKIFTVNPDDRIDIKDLRKCKFFQKEKNIKLTIFSTDTQGGEQDQEFEKQKFIFLQQIYLEVKILRFLNNWEENCFKFYINKVSLTILEHLAANNEDYKKKYKEIHQETELIGNFINSNMKNNNNIHKLADYFMTKANTFSDFKQPYRLVIGHVFSKAHKSITENIPVRSQIKIQLFCCHLINRIFEKQHRNDIFTSYFQWLGQLKKKKIFAFSTFKEWIKVENPQKLVQTVETMNEKFYKKK